MKSTHFDLLAPKSIAHVSIPRQGRSIAIRLDSNEQAVKIEKALAIIGYTVKPGEIAGRGIPLLIGRRAA